MSDRAQKAYAIFRGGFRNDATTPPHWDNLEPWMRDAITVAHFQGKLDAPDPAALVDRFLAWPLPKSVCSDGCVTDANYQFPRSGTNLLTAEEAKQMIEHLLCN